MPLTPDLAVMNTQAPALSQQFDHYAQWRANIARILQDYQAWLQLHALLDVPLQTRLQQQLQRLQADKLHVAFVAEFSRGKSELINALFFASLGHRLLPSGAGRTTMCPTELHYQADQPTRLSLLPIETNRQSMSLADYQQLPDAWNVLPFDAHDRAQVSQTLQELCRTRRVTPAQAQSLGLLNAHASAPSLLTGDDGLVEIPCWRYAMLNFPHPLLAQGLVILDTPGLNAIGAEPELTMHMLPNAHAVLFILAADTGVTQSEMEVWRRYISGARWKQRGRIAVLNKIDGLWDALKSEHDIQRELQRQLDTTAHTLGLQADQILPVSAQKGLLARVTHDDALLAKSRLLALEQTLSSALLPSKQALVRDSVRVEVADCLQQNRDLLTHRQHGVASQLAELKGLQGKNAGAVTAMMRQVKKDKQRFQQVLQQMQTMQRLFQSQSAQVLQLLALSGLKASLRDTREAMVKAKFTSSLRQAMDTFFVAVQQPMREADQQVQVMHQMLSAMSQPLATACGLPVSVPPAFSLRSYRHTMQSLERIYREQFNTTFNMIAHEKMTLTSKFFETLASRVVLEYETAQRETKQWLAAAVGPLESQLREYHIQLRHRIESVKRIHQAADHLDTRIDELNAMDTAIRIQIQWLQQFEQQLHAALAKDAGDSSDAEGNLASQTTADARQ